MVAGWNGLDIPYFDDHVESGKQQFVYLFSVLNIAQNNTTYFIGGIASDERLFRYQMVHVPNAVYLPFPSHAVNDTMETYVCKFIPSIDLSKPFNIVGNSMGGIMAMELLRHLQPEKTVLISSVKNRKEMPFILKQFHSTRLHKVLPGSGFTGFVRAGSFFKKEITAFPGLRQMVVSMAAGNRPDFLYWCVNAIVNWKGAPQENRNVVHIHGTKDSMFPYKHIRNAIPVEGGTHAMLLSRHREVTSLLLQYL
jgi:pimeloyl-ACP methyl ester carboxylesterase